MWDGKCRTGKCRTKNPVVENAGPVNAGLKCRTGRCKDLENAEPGTQNKLENVAIAIALQLEAARATPVLSLVNYDVMPSLKSLNLYCQLPYYSVFAVDTSLHLLPLPLNICSVSSVPRWNYVPNLNAIERSHCDFNIWPNDLKHVLVLRSDVG